MSGNAFIPLKKRLVYYIYGDMNGEEIEKRRGR